MGHYCKFFKLLYIYIGNNNNIPGNLLDKNQLPFRIRGHGTCWQS